MTGISEFYHNVTGTIPKADWNAQQTCIDFVTEASNMVERRYKMVRLPSFTPMGKGENVLELLDLMGKLQYLGSTLQQLHNKHDKENWKSFWQVWDTCKESVILETVNRLKTLQLEYEEDYSIVYTIARLEKGRYRPKDEQQQQQVPPPPAVKTGLATNELKLSGTA